MSVAVSTPVFEGPLDVLLRLILDDEVDLYQVSITRVVDGYLAETAELGRVDLETATEFLLIAATLVELKSRRLLPHESGMDLDEELALLEERDVLLARLLACKTFKDAAAALARGLALAARSQPRAAGLEEHFVGLAPDLLAGVTPEDLRAAFLRAVTHPEPPRLDLRHVAPIRVSVADAVGELVRTLPAWGTTTFRRLTAGVGERLEVIVRFLALLELYKDGRVELRQAATFGSLEVSWRGSAGGGGDPPVDDYEG
jgi:segregation and condensation protein A